MRPPQRERFRHAHFGVDRTTGAISGVTLLTASRTTRCSSGSRASSGTRLARQVPPKRRSPRSTRSPPRSETALIAGPHARATLMNRRDRSGQCERSQRLGRHPAGNPSSKSDEQPARRGPKRCLTSAHNAMMRPSQTQRTLPPSWSPWWQGERMANPARPFRPAGFFACHRACGRSVMNVPAVVAPPTVARATTPEAAAASSVKRRTGSAHGGWPTRDQPVAGS